MNSTISRPLARLVAAFLAFGILASAQAQGENGFPFVIQALDAASPVSARFLNDHAAGEKGRVVVDTTGHLNLGGKRLRFVGVNTGWIPGHDEAPAVAARLASLGVNIVRFHHIDALWQDSLLQSSTGKGPARINPEVLDRLDFFIAELAKAGIYSNLNLLTGRLFTAADGLPASIDRIDDFKIRHSIGFVDSRLLAMQKSYARELLLHVNPYRKLPPAKDPAVAVVEINNENSLLMSWFNGWLDQIPADFLQQWQSDWNNFLRERFRDDAAMASRLGLRSPAGPELLEGAGLLHAGGRWYLEQHEGARARLEPLPADVGSRISIQQPGSAAWHVQLGHGGLQLDEGTAYTITFRARSADGSVASLDLDLSMDHDPWASLGFGQTVRLGKAWQSYSIPVAVVKGEKKARLVIGGLGLKQGQVDIAAISLRSGADLVPAGASLAKGNWPLIRFDQRDSCPPALMEVWLAFLREKEELYWAGMEGFVRRDLGVEALLAGTINGCSLPSVMERFDIIDSHAYWQHPVFPGQPWDQNNSYVDNISLVHAKDGGTLGSLAMLRVKGKPFSVSEYDHPWANQYAAEGWPMLAAFASFQDWDMIYGFSVDAEQAGGPVRIQSFFDQLGNPAKAAAMPFAARIFRQGLIDPAAGLVSIPASRRAEMDGLVGQNHGWALFNGTMVGADPRLAFQYRMELDYNPAWQTRGLADLRRNFAAQALPRNLASQRGLFFNPEKGQFSAAGKSVLVAVYRPPQGAEGGWDIPAAAPLPGLAITNEPGVLIVLKDRPGPQAIYSVAWADNAAADLRLHPGTANPGRRQNAPRVDRWSPSRIWIPAPSPADRALARGSSWRLAGVKGRLTALDATGQRTATVDPATALDDSLWYILEQ